MKSRRSINLPLLQGCYSAFAAPPGLKNYLDKRVINLVQLLFDVCMFLPDLFNK